MNHNRSEDDAVAELIKVDVPADLVIVSEKSSMIIDMSLRLKINHKSQKKVISQTLIHPSKWSV